MTPRASRRRTSRQTVIRETGNMTLLDAVSVRGRKEEPEVRRHRSIPLQLRKAKNMVRAAKGDEEAQYSGGRQIVKVSSPATRSRVLTTEARAQVPQCRSLKS
jgi:hypothetical protein